MKTNLTQIKPLDLRNSGLSLLLKSFILVLFILPSTELSAQVVINEILPTGSVEIKNLGNATVDVSDYWLCDFPAYQRVGASNITCGNTMLGPGEILTVDDFNTIAADDGEMGLYSNNSFSNANAILDYIEWGSSGHQRASVAAAAGIWTQGNFVPAFSAGESLEYDGEGDNPGDWAATATPSLCDENSNAFVCDVDGGTISTNDNTVICVDGNPDPIDVSVSGSSGTNGGWIITDDANNILALPMAPPFDLDGAGAGVCIIWYIRYEDGLTGKTAGNNLSDLDGCFDLSNGINVIREVPDGGTVTLTNGNTTYAQCAGQIVFDVMHTTTAPNLSYWYIITDDNDNILGWVNSANSNTLDLSDAPAGTCRIWGWSYRGLGDPVIGDNISTLTDDDCEDISDSFITVYREIPDGGTVALTNGDTTYAQCSGQIVFDVMHTTTAPNLSYWYIITDDSDNILGWVNSANSNTIDISAAPAGTCRIWGWNYRGLDDPIIGENISTLTDDFCEDISDNFITVYREVPDGGTVALTNGDTTYAQCAGQIVFDVMHTTTAPNLSYWYIITDDNDNILGWVNSANSNTIDISVAPAGTCRIWGWNYRGLDDPIIGENISTLTDDFCEDISDNFITVYREVPDGGTVALTNGDTTYAQCAGQIVFDVMHTTTAPNLSYWYIITDDNDNILGWVNSANSNTLDLSDAPAGTCRVWGWNYRGLDDPIIGENISTLTDDFCEDISDNFITVYREVPDGGMVSLTNGETSIELCAGDVVFDVQHTTTAPNLSYWYIITDANDDILDWVNAANSNTLDLSGAPAGECHVWGWNYRGLGDPVVGENLSTLTDDFCEDISDNFITVNRVSEGSACITSTRDISSVSGLNLYPNPASNQVTIAYEGLESANGQLSLLDLTGRSLRQFDLRQQNDVLQIDVNDLPNGVYLIRITSGRLTSTEKLSIFK